ncbi:uncharacterized protein LOC123311191 [Coccinella septempunctata]|uniref:uncharacterized protein LOC123311191 n=1 Tax=Coccinella septempunctata TaxID=41139 RepID=UPI001D096FFB|nr:uncharacterized protein LOC123311191 [Coccinella septempunctata]
MESKVFKQIAYELNKSSKLQKLFLKWLDLNNTEKKILNNLVSSIIPHNRNCYFLSIMKGFQLWNDLQDKEGACGFHDNPADYEFCSDEEKFLFSIVLIMNIIIKEMLRKNMMLREVENFGGFRSSKKIENGSEELIRM